MCIKKEGKEGNVFRERNMERKGMCLVEEIWKGKMWKDKGEKSSI